MTQRLHLQIAVRVSQLLVSNDTSVVRSVMSAKARNTSASRVNINRPAVNAAPGIQAGGDKPSCMRRCTVEVVTCSEGLDLRGTTPYLARLRQGREDRSTDPPEPITRDELFSPHIITGRRIAIGAPGDTISSDIQLRAAKLLLTSLAHVPASLNLHRTRSMFICSDMFTGHRHYALVLPRRLGAGVPFEGILLPVVFRAGVPLKDPSPLNLPTFDPFDRVSVMSSCPSLLHDFSRG